MAATTMGPKELALARGLTQGLVVRSNMVRQSLLGRVTQGFVRRPDNGAAFKVLWVNDDSASGYQEWEVRRVRPYWLQEKDLICLGSGSKQVTEVVYINLEKSLVQLDGYGAADSLEFVQGHRFASVWKRIP